MGKQRLHCFNCGEDLGEGDHWPGDIEACGNPECRRAEQDAYRERDDMAREAAESDNLDRYR
jgi:hypothetical protein